MPRAHRPAGGSTPATHRRHFRFGRRARTKTGGLALAIVLLAVGSVCNNAAAEKDPLTEPAFESMQALARHLVRAIQANAATSAVALLPTRQELLAMGLHQYAGEASYRKFVAWRRQDFARVVADHHSRHPTGCKTLQFSEIVATDQRRIGFARALSNAALAATCDGRQITLVEPDGLVKIATGWLDRS